MENKKLLKFLLKDLSELEELVDEKGTSGFEELEIEFIQNRLKGAKRLIQILNESEESRQSQFQLAEEEKTQSPPPEEIIEKISPPEPESETEVKEVEETVAETENEEILEETPEPVVNELDTEELQEEATTEEKDEHSDIKDKEVELVDEEVKDNGNKRLGDSFSKEKSVNELVNTDTNKLEHKISNLPVSSIKAAIGINDRFQYIRELFDGNADVFSKAVAKLDTMNNIQEAVKYLQQNYKWKKNETSLKFVNLVKRRFPNE
ncbi:MAG: hypothetical protein ABFS16_09895 [Bacteroidota bacterium]